MNKYTFPTILASVLLFIALFDGLPYGYFTLLRFIVCIAGAYLAYSLHKTNINQIWIWIFVLISILFNPIIPIYLDRSEWMPIDFIVGVLLLISLPKTKKFLK